MAGKKQESGAEPPRVAPTTDAKPFYCDECNTKGFKTIGAKQRHIREEHGPLKYECKYCEHCTKRRYQLARHMDEAHPGQQGTINNFASNQGSRDSIDGHSSDEATAGPLHRARGSQFQHSPTDAGTSQYSTGTLYPTNTSVASYYNNNPTPLSYSRNQTQSYSIQPSYSTTSPNVPSAQSSGIPWRASSGVSQFMATNPPSSDPPTMGSPNQVDNTFSSPSSYYSENSRGSVYNSSPYASLSSERSANGYSTGNSYTGEAGQPNGWPDHPSARPR